MNERNLKFIFFDIGGVLLNNGWGHESRQKAARLFDFDYDETEILHNFIFNVYETGKLTLDEYLDTILFYKPRKFSRDEFKSFMYADSIALPQMLDGLKKWKKEHPEYPVIAINNEGRELNDYRIKKFNLHDCFDAFVSSCETGMRKPDPGIFTLALGIAQAEPAQCIYFDDRIVLVQAAQRLGIGGHQHKDYKTTIQLLDDFISMNNIKDKQDGKY